MGTKTTYPSYEKKSHEDVCETLLRRSENEAFYEAKDGYITSSRTKDEPAKQNKFRTTQ